MNEGTEHLECFRDLGLVVREYPVENAPYLRALTLARPVDPAVKDAIVLYRDIISELTKAYATGRVEDRAAIIQARDAMTKLNDVADILGGRGGWHPVLLAFPGSSEPSRVLGVLWVQISFLLLTVGEKLQAD